ncbi:hypothetical protein ACFRMQ_00245 [Kitasatospora sp. NPDC056783]|uniref:hypothetical protein n=1 Tax=Kitasatospora sp. NPDC056783 TaxID=3345943 RepID=UPI0036918673
MTEPLASTRTMFTLPADPNDITALDSWLRPLGWCVEPDPAQARPGYLRLRPRYRADPDDHDGGLTFVPGTTVRWTGSDLVRVAPAMPASLLPLLDAIGNPTRRPAVRSGAAQTADPGAIRTRLRAGADLWERHYNPG